MREIQQTVYFFEELSEEAQEKAISDYRESIWVDYTEIDDSFKEANQYIWGELEAFQVDLEEMAYHNFCPETVKGVRLYKWLMNNLSYLWSDKVVYVKINEHSRLAHSYPDHKLKTILTYADTYKEYKTRVSKVKTKNTLEHCPLTGTTYDFDAIQPIIDFVKNPSENITLYDLLNSKPDIQTSYDNHYEWETSDEVIKEFIINQDMEYFVDGTEFN